MPAIAFHGLLHAAPGRPELAAGLPDSMILPRHSADVQYARAGRPSQRIDCAEDDVVELELEGGLRLWLRAGEMADDLRLPAIRGDASAVELPAILPVGVASRGAGEWVIRGLKVFGIDISGTIVEFVSSRVEGRLQPGPGLYRCTAGLPGTWPLADKGLTGQGPTLVLLHGTASSTDGSFGGLWEGEADARIQGLLTRYEGRVLAFQHRTLTESPIQNALALAQALVKLLPRDAEIHLVSHSRGGLIGELLSRGMRPGGVPFDREDLAHFGETRGQDIAALRRLGEVLASSRLRVGRFVRVACPARGTTLADGRLDRYFGLLANIVGLVPGLRANPVYEGLTSLVAGVLKKRTEPDALPGLEAMVPGSALVLMLNRPDVRTRADLHVLGGDLEGTGLWSRLKTLATDLFYRDDHDLVVNTPSMFGGVPRADGKIRYWIDAGAEVTHFHYFTRGDTASRLVSALTASDASAGYRELAEKPSEVTSDDYLKRSGAPQPVVFVVPGIMGSTLSRDGARIWLDFLNLSRGGLSQLAAGVAGIEAEALVPAGYRSLVRYLSLSHEVMPVPYDWRLSVEAAAAQLLARIQARLDRAEAEGQPIRVLAHSMGGLVVRAMIASPEGSKAWARMGKHPGSRLVMLGTPSRGSHAIAAMLIGRDALTRKLALLDLRHSYAELLQVIARFDGVLDMLPHDGTLDLFQAAAWDRLFQHDVPPARGLFSGSVAGPASAGFAWVKPDARQLARASQVRDRLRQSPIDPDRMIYVAGCADETPCDVHIDETAPGDRRVAVLATARGDGRVPWATGIPAELAARTYYMDAEHGNLASAEAHFPALLDLLENGVTTKLSRTAPARRGGADEVFPARSPMPSMVPDADDLAATALGSSRPARPAEPDRRVRVRIVHDNLSRAASPVMVGHYAQDVLVSAERYLDRQLEGRLSELRRMDLYPGPIGTAVAVLNEPDAIGGRHPGAIVVGLGTVGDLTPGRLAAALAQGLTTYGAECVGRERRRRQRGRVVDAGATVIAASVSAVLIGSGEGGVSLSDSLQAILQAVQRANLRLALPAAAEPEQGASPAGGGDRLTAFIDQVDVLELFEDRAIQAVRALNGLAQSQQVREDFLVDEVLVAGADGEQRPSFEEGADWWQRIRIVSESAAGPVRDGGAKAADRSEALRFEAITGRAGAEGYLRPTQRRLIERFLARSGASTARDEDLGYTLFELLVPPSFKEYAPDRRHLTLLLDEPAARFPWELMHDRHDRGARPLSVETAMIRQLLLPPEVRREARALGDLALVIGNPTVSDRRFPPLPGAAGEARAVTDLLGRHGFAVTRLIGPEDETGAESILAALYRQPWRVLHLAGHGVVDFKVDDDAEPVTGMVLDGGIFLTPAELAQMRFVPDLVFINCCFLGRMPEDAERVAASYHVLAANVATQLIRMGARAVVAAGWEVDDSAAKTFAATFYARMLEGAMFGEAVAAARRDVYHERPGTNTWGAYQCYGDPALRLPQGHSASATAGPERPVALREAYLRLDAIAKQIRNSSSADERAALGRQLEAIVKSCPDDWRRDASIAGAIGAAYGELGSFDEAVRYYERAAAAESGGMPLRAVEQFANLLSRSVPDRAGRPELARFAKAERALSHLLAIGETAERRALMGSLYKRKAMVMAGPARRRALGMMAAAYGRAYKIKKNRGDRDAWYPLLNQLGAEVVLGWDVGRGRRGRAHQGGAPAAARLDELARLAEAARDDARSFAELSLPADSHLLAALGGGALDEAERLEIAVRYRRALIRGSSARDLDSIRSHIAFFERMAEGQPGTRSIRGSLERLRTSLDGPGPPA